MLQVVLNSKEEISNNLTYITLQQHEMPTQQYAAYSVFSTFFLSAAGLQQQDNSQFYSFATCKTQAHKHVQNKTQKGARNRRSKTRKKKKERQNIK